MCDAATVTMLARAAGEVAAGSAQRALAESDARMVEIATRQRMRAVERQRAQALGEARGAASVSGVSVSSDSVVEAEREIQRAASQDSLVTLINGQNEAAQLRIRGRMAQAEAWARLAGDTSNFSSSRWRTTNQGNGNGGG